MAVPVNFQTGLVVPLFEERDQMLCSIHGRIPLLGLPGQVHPGLLEKIVEFIVEPQIQEEQCGFHPGRETLDQLCTLTRILH